MLAAKKFKPNSQDTTTITVETESQLTREFDSISSCLGNLDNDWEKRADAMRRLKGLVRGGAHRAFPSQFAEHLTTRVRDPLSKQFCDLRSSLVKEASQCVDFLMDNLDVDVLDQLADTLVDGLLRMLGTTNKVLLSEGHSAMKATLRKAHVTRGLQKICACALTSKMPSLKQLCVEYIGIIIQRAQNYSQAFFDRSFDEIEKVLKKSLSDSDPNVRSVSRATFWTYYLTWESRGTAFLKTVDDNVKKNLIKEDPRASTAAKPPQTAPQTASQNLGTLGNMPESGVNTPVSKGKVLLSANRTPISPLVSSRSQAQRQTASNLPSTAITPGKNQLTFTNPAGTLTMDLSDDDGDNNDDGNGNIKGTSRSISQQMTPIKGDTGGTAASSPPASAQGTNTSFFTPKRNAQIDRVIGNNTGMTPYTSPRMKLERNVIPKILNNANSDDTSAALSQVTTLTRLKKALEDLKSYDVTPHASMITLFLKEAMASPQDPLLILEVVDILLKKYSGSIVYSLDEVLPFVLSRRTEHPALCTSIEGTVAAEFSQEILVPAATRALAASVAAAPNSDGGVSALAITEFLEKLLDRSPDFFRDSSKLKTYIPPIASVALDNESEDARVAASHLLGALFSNGKAEFTAAFLSLPQAELLKLREPLIGLVPDLGVEVNKKAIEKNIYFMTKSDANELAKTSEPHHHHPIIADSTPIKSSQSDQITLSPQADTPKETKNNQEKRTPQGIKPTNSSTNDSVNGSTGPKGGQKVFTAKEIEEAVAGDARPFPVPVKKVLYMLGKAASRKLKACPEAFREFNALLAFSKQQKQQLIDDACINALSDALCVCAGPDQELRMRAMGMNGLKELTSAYPLNAASVKSIVLLCMDAKKKYGTTIVGDGEKVYKISLEIWSLFEGKYGHELFEVLLEVCRLYSSGEDKTLDSWSVEFALQQLKSLCKVVGNDFLDKGKENFVGIVSLFAGSDDLGLRKEGINCLAQACAVMQKDSKEYVDFTKSKLSNFQGKLLEHYIGMFARQ